MANEECCDGSGDRTKKAQKKHNLLCAAQELFLQNGVSKTSISEIVEQAHVAKGTFYLYFQDKDDLLEHVIYRLCHDIIQQAFEYAEQHRADDFADNVVLFIDWIITYFTKHTNILQLIHRNFSWPLTERGLQEYRDDPLWHNILSMLTMRTPMIDSPSADDLFKTIYIIIQMCGTICYSSMIEQKPDTIENMKPILYNMIRRILI